MSNLSEFGPRRGRRGVQRDRFHEDGVSTRRRCHVGPLPVNTMLRAGADPDQRALNEINSFDGPLLIADIVSKIKNIRDFAGKKKRGLAKLDPQNYEDMGPGPASNVKRPSIWGAALSIRSLGGRGRV